MVPSATIITVSITLFICLALPVIVYLVYGVKNKGKGVWTAWLLGAAGFFVFQILLRSPILSVVYDLCNRTLCMVLSASGPYGGAV